MEIRHVQDPNLEVSQGAYEKLTRGGRTMVDWHALSKASRAVCRITTPGGLGTGFVISNNLIMTNHHVLRSPDEASKSYAEFFLSKKVVTIGLAPAAFFAYSPAPQNGEDVDADHLDYTIVAVNKIPGVDKVFNSPFAFFECNQRLPSEAFIIQHPGGGTKKFSLGSNQIVSMTELVIHYTTETDYGSSGSPVLSPFDEELKLLGLHHRRVPGKDLNQGVRLKAIMADMAKNCSASKLILWIPAASALSLRSVPGHTSSPASTLANSSNKFGHLPLDQVKALAEQGNVDAQFYLGEFYISRYMGEPITAGSKFEAAGWYRLAATQGHVEAMYKTGLYSIDGSIDSTWMKEAANRGHSGAQYMVGLVAEDSVYSDCSYGNGAAPNFEAALSWFQKSANQDHALALFKLGSYYESGKSDIYGKSVLTMNGSQALSCFHRSAHRDCLEGMLALARCYQRGIGTGVNDSEALFWLNKAAEKGSIDAQVELGNCYRDGKGTAQNLQLARYWLNKAEDAKKAQQPDSSCIIS